MLRTKLSHVNEGGVAAGMNTLLGHQYSTLQSRILQLSKTTHLLLKKFRIKTSRTWGPGLLVPGGRQELLPSNMSSEE